MLKAVFGLRYKVKGGRPANDEFFFYDHIFPLHSSNFENFNMNQGVIYESKWVFRVDAKNFQNKWKAKTVEEGLEKFELRVKKFTIDFQVSVGEQSSVYDQLNFRSLPLLRALTGAQQREVYYFDGDTNEYVAEIPLLFDMCLAYSQGFISTETTKSFFSSYTVPNCFMSEVFVKIRHNVNIDRFLNEHIWKKSYHLCSYTQNVLPDDSSCFKINFIDNVAWLPYTPCNGMFFIFVDEDGHIIEDGDLVDEVSLFIGDHKYDFTGRQLYTNCKKFHELQPAVTKKVHFQKDVSFGCGVLPKDVWNYIIFNHMNNMQDLKHLLSTCKAIHSIGQMQNIREHILQKVRLPGHFSIPFNNNKLFVDKDVAGNTINLWCYGEFGMHFKVSKKYAQKEMTLFVYFSAFNITMMNGDVVMLRFVH